MIFGLTCTFLSFYLTCTLGQVSHLRDIVNGKSNIMRFEHQLLG